MARVISLSRAGAVDAATTAESTGCGDSSRSATAMKQSSEDAQSWFVGCVECVE